MNTDNLVLPLDLNSKAVRFPDSPTAVCICPTYNRCPDRIGLLQETVYWFLQQDYKNKKLLILNDHPKQTLYCFENDVIVVNSQARYSSLGAKYNAMVIYALRILGAEIILPFEDDDISLPHRISQAVAALKHSIDHKMPAYFNPQQSWFEYFDNRLRRRVLSKDHTHGVCHNASAFNLYLAKAVKYRNVSGAPDAWFDQDARQYCYNQSALSQVLRLGGGTKEWSYIYRWGNSDFHLSGAGADKTEAAYTAYGLDGKQGNWVIEAKMKVDYVEEIKNID